LIRQQVELIGTEGVTLEFDDDAIREIARCKEIAYSIERTMEELSFKAAEMEKGSKVGE
jgi:ATP-dependent HslUV protease ATP-binding subunit HslU